MSNAKKYAGIGPSEKLSSDAPEWLRLMSDRYVDTGTVSAQDAARLRGQPGNVSITQAAGGVGNGRLPAPPSPPAALCYLLAAKRGS